MIDRINDFVARRLGGVGTSVGSFVRIHIWIVVFLVVISLILPTPKTNVAELPINRKIEDVNVRSLALDTNDPRGFAPSPFGKNRFRIAWITGSEGQVHDLNYYKFVPQLVVGRLPFLGGRKVGVDLYFLPAMRLGDSYLTLLKAIKTKPDMIVLDLNPAWVFNPLAIHQWGQLDQIGAAELASTPSKWPLAAELFSPSDFMWALGAKTFQPVRDRAYYGARIHAHVDDQGPLVRNRASFVTRDQTLSQQVLGMLPVDFWYQYRLDETREPGPESWARVLDVAKGGGGPLNRTLLHDIGAALKDSKIPSYVYLAQVNSNWLANAKDIRTAVGDIESHLKERSGDFAADNIVYQPLTISRFVHQLSFDPGDLVHLTSADSMGPYLALQLCRLAVRTGSRANCANVGRISSGG